MFCWFEHHGESPRRAVEFPFVAVDDTDATHARAVERGAKTIVAPNDNGMGRGAMIEDPQGAALGLFTAAPGATDGVNPHGQGFMCWCELVTPDPAASAAFLGHVLGWTFAEQAMGPNTVTIASAGGHLRGPRCAAALRPDADPRRREMAADVRPDGLRNGAVRDFVTPRARRPRAAQSPRFRRFSATNRRW